MTSDPDGVTALLRDLGARLGMRIAVYVTRTRDPRYDFITGHVGERERAELVELADAWLVEASTRGSAGVDVEILADHPHVAVTSFRGPDDKLVGAALVAKQPGTTWTAADRDLLRFGADYNAGAIVDMLRRPRPNDRVPLTPRPSPDDVARGLAEATGNGEMYVLYQPEVELATGRTVAVEALVRWRHPRLGELRPDTFITVAEQSDVIKVLGALVVAEAFGDLAEWRRQLPGLDLRLRVNVSPVQLVDADFASLVAAALTEHELPGDRVCVELTENVPVRSVGVVADQLRALKALGVTSAIDDFASGLSSLGRLRVLPVDDLKIDRSLIAGLDHDHRARTIVRSVLNLAAELGLDVVSEGVETEAEALALAELGGRLAQGHLYGRPMPARAVYERLLAARSDTVNPDSNDSVGI